MNTCFPPLVYNVESGAVPVIKYSDFTINSKGWILLKTIENAWNNFPNIVAKSLMFISHSIY